MTVSPSGLRQPDCEELVWRDACRRGQSGCRADFRLQPQRDVLPQHFSPRILGYVQVGLVERQRFDQRRHGSKNREYRLRNRAVLVKVRTDDHQVRAQADGARHRNRRPHAEQPRLVARGGHDTARGRGAAHGNRPPFQFGIVTLLDRRVKGVHVDVKDPAHVVRSVRRYRGRSTHQAHGTKSHATIAVHAIISMVGGGGAKALTTYNR